MSQIGEIKKLSDTRFLNFYEFEAVHRDGTSAPYFVASRAKKIEQLKAVSHENKPDGVILFGVYGEKKDRVVLVRQYLHHLDVVAVVMPPAPNLPVHIFHFPVVGLDQLPLIGRNALVDLFGKERHMPILLGKL